MALNDINVIGNCPCKNCTNRKVGCHGTCKLYAKWQKEQRKYSAKVRSEKLKDRYGNAWMGEGNVKKYKY